MGMPGVRPLFVSFYTPDDLYRGCAERLKASLDHFGLDYEINEIVPTGCFTEILCQKSPFIIAKRQKYPDRNVVWIDADSEVVHYPYFLEYLTADISTPMYKDREILSCLIFFANTPAASVFLQQWDQLNQINTETYTSDQDNFGILLRRIGSQIRYFQLPNSYAYVPDETNEVDVPVIKQYLVSRTKNGRDIYSNLRENHANKMLGMAI